MIRSLIASGVFRPAAHTPRQSRLKPMLRRCLPVVTGLAVIAAGVGLFSQGGSSDGSDVEPIRAVRTVVAPVKGTAERPLSADLVAEVSRVTKAAALSPVANATVPTVHMPLAAS